MPLCTCWSQDPNKCINYFQVFLKKLTIQCIYLFFKEEKFKYISLSIYCIFSQEG